jgi:hypothetical protein
MKLSVLLPIFAFGLCASAVACDGLLGIHELDGGLDAEDAGDGSSNTYVPGAGIDGSAGGADAGQGIDSSVADAGIDADAGSDAEAGADAAAEGGDAGVDTGPPLCFPRPSGLVSWWRADGNADDSIGPNNGTTSNVAYVPGLVGKAFEFLPGIDDGGFVTAGVVGLPTGGADRTVELWARLEKSYVGSSSVLAEGLFFGYGQFGSYNSTYELLVTGGGAGSIATDSFTFSQWGDQVNRGSLTENVWHHVAATLASGTVELFIDGVPTASGTPTIDTSGGDQALIGGIPKSVVSDPKNNQWFTGAVDEVSVYSRALSAVEIQGIYAAGSAGKCP